MRIFEGPFGPVYGSGEGREKKKNLPNLAPGAPFTGGQGGPKRAHILVATLFQPEVYTATLARQRPVTRLQARPSA